MVFAVLFKKPPEDDSYKTKLIVPCGRVKLPNSNYRSFQARALANCPPPRWILEADRYQMQLKERMRIIVCDFILYAIFIAITLVLIYLMRDPAIYNQNEELYKLFDANLVNVCDWVKYSIEQTKVEFNF